MNTAFRNKTGKEAGYEKESQFIAVLKRLLKKPFAVIGMVVLAVIILLTVFADALAPYNYDEQDVLNKNLPASIEHLMGTDSLGRDTFSRILVGGRNSLIAGFASAILSAVVGSVLGLIAGYFGNLADNIIGRFLDILQAIPGMMLAMTISAILGPGYFNTIIAISVGGIAGFARMARAATLSLKDVEYIEAATSINASRPRIMFRHILPNVLSPLIVQFTGRISNSILQVAGLSFIGLGIQPPATEWGAMVSASREFIRTAPMQCIYPAVAIMIVVFAISLFGDGLRDALDPKMKN